MEDNKKESETVTSPFAQQNPRAEAITDLSKLGELEERQSQTLIRIEDLLKQQLAQTVKLRKSDCLRTVVTIIVAIVLIVVSVMMYTMVKDVIKDLPAILANANTLISNANTLILQAITELTAILKKVDSFDFEGINTIIRGVATVNYQALNDSIEGLANTVNTFKSIVDAIRNPFGL